MTVEHEGTVERRKIAKGSKSEREAVVLKTDAREIVLRRQGGNPFKDPELDELVGKHIRAHGSEHGQTLIMDAWEET